MKLNFNHNVIIELEEFLVQKLIRLRKVLPLGGDMLNSGWISSFLLISRLCFQSHYFRFYC